MHAVAKPRTPRPLVLMWVLSIWTISFYARPLAVITHSGANLAPRTGMAQERNRGLHVPLFLCGVLSIWTISFYAGPLAVVTHSGANLALRTGMAQEPLLPN